jgi:ATP-dependent DNA helicase RecQ
MAQVRPTSLSALAQVSGVGEAKLEKYGRAFVDVIEGFG